jgi:hypothetical protein
MPVLTIDECRHGYIGIEVVVLVYTFAIGRAGSLFAGQESQKQQYGYSE